MGISHLVCFLRGGRAEDKQCSTSCYSCVCVTTDLWLGSSIPNPLFEIRCWPGPWPALAGEDCEGISKACPFSSSKGRHWSRGSCHYSQDYRDLSSSWDSAQCDAHWSQKDTASRAMVLATPSVQGCPLAKIRFPTEALSEPLHPLDLLPAKEEGTWLPAQVTFDPLGELGTNTSPEANSPIQSNMTKQIRTGRAGCEWKPSTSCCGLASPGFSSFECRLILLFYLINTSNGKKDWKKLLPHHGGLSPSSTVLLRGILPVFLENEYIQCLCKRAGRRSHAWRRQR